MQLGKRFITKNSSPYVIAEIGVNHDGSFEKAKNLIYLAKVGGADAAKFQCYKANTLACKNAPAYWNTSKEPTKSQYDLFQKYDNFGPKEYVALANYCKELNIDFIATPFDDASIEFLDPIMSFYKIASADITNLPFLRKIAKKNKPIILSTGGSTIEEIDLALKTLHISGCKDIALLHCILNYPTKNKNANLSMISALKNSYPDNLIGYSDHTLPCDSMVSLVTAVHLGAVIIEKHFTYDKSLTGNDHYHAMDKNDLNIFLSKINHTNFSNELFYGKKPIDPVVEKIKLLIGVANKKKPIPSESISRLNARRSIVLSKKIYAGEIFNEDNLTYKRPGTGISPKYWDKVIGMKALTDLEVDYILQWQDTRND